MLTLKGNRIVTVPNIACAVHLFIYLFIYLFMQRFESDLGENHCLSMFLILINVFKVNFPIFS